MADGEKEPGLWLGGAVWGAGDQTDRFLSGGIWQNGYEDRYLERVRSIAVGDVFVIKSTTTQKHNLPFEGAAGQRYSKMPLKAKGVVVENLGDGRTIRVAWDPDWAARDWWHYTYLGTLWKPRRDEPAAEALRAFILDGVPQDHGPFLGTVAEDDTPLHKDISRMLRRLPISRGQLVVYKTVLDDPGGATEADVAEALQGTNVSRVLWALGRRIQYTDRATRHEGLDLVFTQETDAEGALRYRARPELRQVVAADDRLADFLEQDLDAVVAGSPWDPGPVPDPPPIRKGTEPPVAAPLTLWSFDDQYRGMATTGGLERPLDVLRAARLPVSQADLLEQMGDEMGFVGVKEVTRKASLSRLQGLGLLRRHQDGTWQVSDAGRRAVELAHLSPIIEAFIVRVYGIAQLLRRLVAGPAPRAALVKAMRAEYPRWTSNTAPYQLMGWCIALELIEQTGPTLALTASGAAWAARLPAELPTPPVAPKAPDALPDLAALLSWLEADEESKGLVFSRAQLRSVFAAWRFHPRKRFVLLSGLSGTGKTQLLLQLARATCGRMGLSEEDHIVLVPVSPDWHDPAGLLGHLNTLHDAPRFHREPALELLQRAAENPDLPYFLLLDEMNLAPVERWFAPFLSAMESGRPLLLHGEPEEVDGVPPQLDWPANLRIGGTVNMDETTHAFSDKVLDRAFTLEFWDVDLPAFFARRGEGGGDEAAVRDTLLALQAELVRVRRAFGYRSAGEVLDWVAMARAADPGANLPEVLDQAVLSKILPRLRGADSLALQAALTALDAACRERDLPRSAAKLRAMALRLKETGITGFWS